MPKASRAKCTRCGKEFMRVNGMFGKKVCDTCRTPEDEEKRKQWRERP